MHKTTNYHSFSLKLLELLESSVILMLGCFVTVIHCNTIFNHRHTYGTGDSGESSTLHANTDSELYRIPSSSTSSSIIYVHVTTMLQ